MEFRIKRAPRLESEITVPGDKSISHRAVMIGSLTNGACVLRGFLPSDDCLRTVQAMRALGIKIEHPEPEMLVVHGKKRLLTAPSGEIDCGNSATTMRLLAGLLAGQNFDSVLVGGATLSARPMDRVIVPLRKMGANITAQGPNETAPVKIHGVKLRGARHELPIAIAQVKSALLLAGLFAKGKTTVREPLVSRNHTELMLNYFLVRTSREDNGAINIFGDQVPESRDFTIPGDISSASFSLVAGALAGGTTIIRQAEELRVKESDRIAAIAHNLRAMGVEVVEQKDGLEIHGRGELRGARVASFGDHRIAMAFAIAGMFADGETIVQDVECVRESYPGFEKTLDEFVSAKRIRVTTPVISSLTPAKVDEE